MSMNTWPEQQAAEKAAPIADRRAMRKAWLEALAAARGDKIARIALKDPDGFRRHFTENAA